MTSISKSRGGHNAKDPTIYSRSKSFEELLDRASGAEQVWEADTFRPLPLRLITLAVLARFFRTRKRLPITDRSKLPLTAVVARATQDTMELLGLGLEPRPSVGGGALGLFAPPGTRGGRAGRAGGRVQSPRRGRFYSEEDEAIAAAEQSLTKLSRQCFHALAGTEADEAGMNAAAQASDMLSSFSTPSVSASRSKLISADEGVSEDETAAAWSVLEEICCLTVELLEAQIRKMGREGGDRSRREKISPDAAARRALMSLKTELLSYPSTLNALRLQVGTRCRGRQ